jgi:hypothetical protein
MFTSKQVLQHPRVWISSFQHSGDAWRIGRPKKEMTEALLFPEWNHLPTI